LSFLQRANKENNQSSSGGVHLSAVPAVSCPHSFSGAPPRPDGECPQSGIRVIRRTKAVKIRSIAYSKINLFLKVTGKRPDGYHEILSFFLPLTSPADHIVLTVDDLTVLYGIEIICRDKRVPADETNICHKAASRYAAMTGLPAKWRIEIDKKIPVAAGMGGGSSDAAAALQMLQKHYKQLPLPVLGKAALHVGADVPFFMESRPAIVSGVGEKLEFLPPGLPEMPIVIVNPGFPVSSKWAYGNMDPALTGPADRSRFNALVSAVRAGNFKTCAGMLHNDLAPAVFHKFPILQILKKRLLAHGALGAEMTGSGPAVFAICGDFAHAGNIAAAMRREFPEMEVFVSGKSL
jgi:4-diphosphocytidyl-2-C-methyl-D-erythritol kinase